MRKFLETGILLFAVAGFWGMIYPDLCFISDVCGIEYVYEDTCEQVAGEDSGERQSSQGEELWEPDIYTRICEAKPEQIKVKSRLLEFFCK